MKNLFILFLGLIAVINTTAQDWQWQNLLPQGNSFQSVHFTDLNTGYAVGESGIISKTLDGGATWNTLSSGTNNHLFSVYFIDAYTGYVVGEGGTILNTINGGG